MQTYPEMNEKIVGILRLTDDPTTLYAAQRIEELEQQLQAERVEQSHMLEAAMAQAIKLEQQLREARATVTELRRKDADYGTNRTSTPETGALGREISPPLAEVGE